MATKEGMGFCVAAKFMYLQSNKELAVITLFDVSMPVKILLLLTLSNTGMNAAASWQSLFAMPLGHKYLELAHNTILNDKPLR